MMIGTRKSILNWVRLSHLAAIWVVCFITSLTFPAAAQQVTNPAADTVVSLTDTAAKRDSTLSQSALEDSLGIRISPDALPAVVTSTATDSAIIDLSQNRFFLYGDAEVTYEDLKLKANEIAYDQAENTVMASPGASLIDSPGKSKRPTFTQGSETFTYDYLKYNFKSKRAMVRNAKTQYGEGYVHSEQVKRNPDNSIYGYHSIYTTCALDTPHFGIYARKIKVVPGQIVVSGSANLAIEGVPTPLVLPFGVFPITESQRSGFRIPSYTIEEQRGLGITNGGYYFNMSEYFDLLVLASFYSKGSYNTSVISTYANRYRFNGGFSFNYAYNKQGEAYEPGNSIQKQFAIQWRHATDPKARPGQGFNANVQIQKGNYYTDNSYNPNLIVQNQYQSNISYQKNWVGKPYSLTVSALFRQNTATHIADLSLPEFNFYVSQLTPFARKNRIGASRWYEKINISYNLNSLAQTSFYDTSFHLSTLALTDFQAGVRHVIPVNAAYTVAKYLNLSFGANYNEYWLTDEFYRYYNTTEDKLDTIHNRGFYAARDFSANMQLSTRIYGIKRWRTGTLAGIRHVLTPNVGLNYVPDYAAPPFQYYYQAYLTPGGSLAYYSQYVNSVVGVPGLGQYGDFASIINFGLNNNLQIKTRTGKDSAASTKNITLIDGFSLNSAYNLAADSFKLAGLAMSFRTNILDKISVTANANFDPYVYDHYLGRRINTYKWDNGGGLNFQNANISLSSSFRSNQNSRPKAGSDRADTYARLMQSGGYNDYIDFNIPWSLNIAYNLSVNKIYRSYEKGGDTVTINQSALFSGDFNLSAHWKFSFSSGYDFTSHSLTLTSFDIYRDLHCWEMRMGTIPFGPRKNYNFTINVKASVLQDLKMLRRRDYRDAAF